VVEAVLDVGERLLGRGEAALGGLHFGGDAVLFALEQVERDRAGVVGLEELGALVGERGEAGLLLAAFQLGVGAAGAEPVAEVGAQGVDPFGAEADAAVVVGDLGLDPVDRERLLGAGGALLVAAEAHEVPVHGAVAVLGVVDGEPGAAGAAEDGPLEVVGVPPLALACGVLGVEHGLDTVPGLDADEGLVRAGVAGAPEGDDALVVGVAEQPVEVRERERLARSLQASRRVEASGRRLRRAGSTGSSLRGRAARRPTP
jgi:hypothetical protein